MDVKDQSRSNIALYGLTLTLEELIGTPYINALLLIAYRSLCVNTISPRHTMQIFQGQNTDTHYF